MPLLRQLDVDAQLSDMQMAEGKVSDVIVMRQCNHHGGYYFTKILQLMQCDQMRNSCYRLRNPLI